MMKIPDKKEFPGTGPSGNGISPDIKSQGQWIHLIKTDSCESCHQLGNEYTRTIPPMFANLDSPAQAWMRRMQSGQAGSAMMGGLDAAGPGTRLGRIRRLDHPHRATANFPRRRRRGRRASSATSSSRSGTGPIRRPICTMKSPPTSAIPTSTPTA